MVTLMLSPADTVMSDRSVTPELLKYAVCEKNGETSDKYVVNYLLTSVFGLTIGSNGESDTSI